VRTYLGALKNLFQLKNEWAAGKGELLEKSLLKGLENIRGQTNRKRKARKTIPVSLKILENVKRSLRLQNWAQGSKICVWAACLVAFWGVFRLGELLPKSELKFDKSSDLLWSDVRISKREEGWMLIKVRGCKVRGNPGNSARLFNLEKKGVLFSRGSGSSKKFSKNPRVVCFRKSRLQESIGSQLDKTSVPASCKRALWK
jgi:hypothetical protein